jgi:hypothetical protein
MTQAQRFPLDTRGVLLLLRLAATMDCYDSLLFGVASAVLEHPPGGGGYGAPQKSGQGQHGRGCNRLMRH